MNDQHRDDFFKMLHAVFEVYSSLLTDAAVDIWWAVLKRYPLPDVRRALNEHVANPAGGHFLPRPADIIGHIQAQDGRIGAEEAWAALPKDEAGSVVWSDEMACAFGVALPLIELGDMIAARMAFLERYRAELQSARAAGVSVHWTPSLGHDARGRESVLRAAQAQGRLTAEHVDKLLPRRNQPAESVLKLIQGTQ